MLEKKEKELMTLMFKNLFNLIQCAMKNCKSLYMLTDKDEKLKKLRMNINKETDNKKRETLIRKLNENKLLIEYQTCLYENCLKEVKEILKNINDIIKYKKVKIDKKYMETSKRLLKKKVLTFDELRELSNIYLILTHTIMHQLKNERH